MTWANPEHKQRRHPPVVSNREMDLNPSSTSSPNSLIPQATTTPSEAPGVPQANNSHQQAYLNWLQSLEHQPHSDHGEHEDEDYCEEDEDYLNINSESDMEYELDDEGSDDDSQELSRLSPEEEAKRQAQVQQLQQEMRQKIVAIQKDESIPAAEKAKRIQDLMTHQWNSRTNNSQSIKEAHTLNKLRDKKSNFDLLTEADMQCTHHVRPCHFLSDRKNSYLIRTKKSVF